MVEIIFGVLWLLITATCTWGFYGTAGDVEVNGILVSHEEFVTMLWPKLFIGIFWVIGIAFIVTGIVNLSRYYISSRLENRNSNTIKKEPFENSKYFNKYEEFNKIEEPDDDDPIKRF